MTDQTGVTFMQPGWVRCGCCAGLEWGGEEPRECRDCGGTGFQWRYSSGRLALYPGGPLKGQEHPDYVRQTDRAAFHEGER